MPPATRRQTAQTRIAAAFRGHLARRAVNSTTLNVIPGRRRVQLGAHAHDASSIAELMRRGNWRDPLTRMPLTNAQAAAAWRMHTRNEAAEARRAREVYLGLPMPQRPHGNIGGARQREIAQWYHGGHTGLPYGDGHSSSSNSSNSNNGGNNERRRGGASRNGPRRTRSPTRSRSPTPERGVTWDYRLDRHGYPVHVNLRGRGNSWMYDSTNNSSDSNGNSISSRRRRRSPEPFMPISSRRRSASRQIRARSRTPVSRR